MKKKQFLNRIGGKQYSIKLELYLWDFLRLQISAEPARRYIKSSMIFALKNDLPITQTVRQFVIRKLAREEVGEAEPTREPAVASNKARRDVSETRAYIARPDRKSEDE